MNISRIVRRVLSERKVDFGTTVKSVTPEPAKFKAKGQNENISYEFLESVIRNCKDIANGAFVNKPVYTFNNDMLYKFPELEATGVKDVAFVTADVGGGDYYIAFGKKDDKAPKPALFAYRIAPNEQPDYIENGLGGRYSCQALTKIEDLGQTQLSPENTLKLNKYIETVGAANVSLQEPDVDINLYDKKSYKDLKYPTTNAPVFDPVPNEPGYIWIKKGISQKLASIPDSIEKLLNSQGFTGVQPSDMESDEARYGIYIKDIMNDFPILKSQGAEAIRPGDIIYPSSTGDTTVMNPSKEVCRSAIKKLDYCIKSSKGEGCAKDLLKNKFRVIRCGDFKYVGGALGLKDEYENVLRTGSPYGVADLKRLVGKAQYGAITEMSLKKKINFILNEERKKFRF